MRLLPLLLAACNSAGNTGATCNPTADRCDGSDICLVDTCVAAFPLTYQAFAVHAQAPEAHDLQVLFAASAHGDPPRVMAMSPIASGQTEVDLDGPFLVDLAADTDTLSVELVDATTGDLLLACAREPVDMDQLRRRDDNCDKEGYWLSYGIVPVVAVADER